MSSLSGAYEIVPGKAVGIIYLGDSLWHILDLLRTHKTQFPKIELSWDPDNAHKSATTIHLPHLILFFPPSNQQTCTLITFPNLPSTPITLTYQDAPLASSSQPLTRARVAKILGPTYAGSSTLKLSYPGIAFEFGSGINGREDQVKVLTVTPRDEADQPLLTTLASCVVKPGQGVTLHVPDPIDIVLGETTSQDLLLDLGPPLRKFWKEDDRVARMWGGFEDGDKGSCFWNYFQHGLDFLVSPDGVITKIISYSNIPGTPLFQRYARCPWIVPTSTGDLDYTSPLSSFRSSLTASAKGQYVDQVQVTEPTKTTMKKRGVSPASSGASGSENVILNSGEQGDAMVLDRSVEGGLEGVTGVGSSRLIGFDGVIVEEDQISGGICSVLVWRDPSVQVA